MTLLFGLLFKCNEYQLAEQLQSLADMSDLSDEEGKGKNCPKIPEYESKNMKKKIEILQKYLLEQADLSF